jgi:hypothetical protein
MKPDAGPGPDEAELRALEKKIQLTDQKQAADRERKRKLEQEKKEVDDQVDEDEGIEKPAAPPGFNEAPFRRQTRPARPARPWRRVLLWTAGAGLAALLVVTVSVTLISRASASQERSRRIDTRTTFADFLQAQEPPDIELPAESSIESWQPPDANRGGRKTGSFLQDLRRLVLGR